MLSDSIGAKTRIPSAGRAVVRVEHTAHRGSKTVSFFWRTVAGFSQHNRWLVNECPGQVVAKSLRNRRIKVVADGVRWCFFRPVILRQRHNPCFAYCSRPRFTGRQKIPLQAQRLSPAWLLAGGQPLAWPKGQGALIGNKVIIAERHGVFCQLLFDYYAVTQPAGERHCTSPWPEVCCGYGENCQQFPEDGWRPCDNPRLLYDARLFSAAPEPCLVLFRQSRFGLWHIKLLAALLLLFILVAGLDAFTGIQGYISLHSVSAAGFLSGLIVALAVIALLVLVMCMLRR